MNKSDITKIIVGYGLILTALVINIFVCPAIELPQASNNTIEITGSLS